MLQPKDNIRESIYSQVSADLAPSRPVVHAKIGGSIALGGFLSLFLCGQLGFGLSDFALSAHHSLMGVVGHLGCTVVCGVLFAVVPVVMLQLISSAVQFRMFINREWRVIVFWVIACGAFLAYRSDRSNAAWVVLTWSAAAVLSFEVLSRVLSRTLTAAVMRLTVRRGA